MAKQRTGTVIKDGPRWYAVVTVPNGPRKGTRFKYRLPDNMTEEQAKAEALRLSTDSDEVERLSRLPKRQRNKKRIVPKLHGKAGRALRTEKGRVVFHQHVVASLVTKTAAEIVKGKRREAIYEIKGCDGSDPVVRICDLMSAQMVSEPLPYIREACE